MFEDVNKIKTTKRNLQDLIQYKTTTNYAFKFQQYTARTKWDDDAFTIQFYKELKKRVKNDIVLRKKSNNLHDMITKTIEIDNRQYECELEKKKSYQTVKRRHQI